MPPGIVNQAAVKDLSAEKDGTDSCGECEVNASACCTSAHEEFRGFPKLGVLLWGPRYLQRLIAKDIGRMGLCCSQQAKRQEVDANASENEARSILQSDRFDPIPSQTSSKSIVIVGSRQR